MLEPRLLFTAVPLITEFVASNSNGLQDEDGDRSDWIEIFNDGDTALDLDGWHLTDDAGNLNQWTFPSEMLEPGEFLIVFASSKDRAVVGSQLHTNFKLGAGGEYLALTNPSNTVVHAYNPAYPSQQADASYGLTMTTTESILVAEGSSARYIVPASAIANWNTTGFNDSAWSIGATGFGYENAPGANPNYTSLIATGLPSGTTSVYLRQAFNVADPSAFSSLSLNVRYDDGFVAYLNGVKVAEDNAPSNPAFNSTALGDHGDVNAVDLMPFDISDHRNLLVAGNNVLAIQGLNLSPSSDYLIEPELVAGIPEVVTPHEIGFFNTPSPGSANGQSFLGIVADTKFSVDRGLYTSPISVAITTATPTASIAYTLDGSAPTVTTQGVITNGMIYTGALNITGTETVRAMGFQAGYQSTNIDTHTYLFPADVINQTSAFTLAQGFPCSWGGISPDYGVDASDVNNTAFINALSAIPTISINLDIDDLFGSNGIYTNSESHGIAWERAASIELINPDGSVGFQEDAGLRIQGGASRDDMYSKKHSLRVIFRDEYGAGKLNFPFFGADAADEFNTITLRMDFNDGWAWGDAGAQPQYARDEFGRQTQLAMGQPASHGNRAHVYLNGVYWGLYNPVERPDAEFAASYYGGDPDNWDAINSGNATDGDLSAWNTLVSLAQAVDNAGSETARTAAYYLLQGKNTDGTNNPLLENYLDVENYADYLITNFYGGNSDWPFKNYYSARERGIDSTGFKFHMWDSEWSLGLRSDVNTNRLFDIRGVAEPYGDLRASAEFRMLFADRAHRALFNDGPLTAANAIARYQSILEEVDGALEAEVGRWGDQHNALGYDKSDWQNESNNVINSFLNGRTNVFVNHLRSAWLYSSVDAVSWNLRGGAVGNTFNIQLTAPQGTIYYTTDGSDPRLIGGAISGNATQYTGSFSLAGHATIRARVLHNGVWSAIDEADFIIADAPADSTNLRVAEVHYNPQGPSPSELAAGFTDGDQFEFIELINTSGQTISLDSVELKRSVAGSNLDGITFAFGLVSLDPGERIVIVSDLAAFQQRYGNSINVAGEYTGNLANSGEILRLTDATGTDIQQFKYDDDATANWTTTPDGGGPSLVVVDTNGDYDDGNNWTASTTTHGTPGEDEAAALVGDINNDGHVGALDLDQLLAYWGDSEDSSPGALAADLDNSGTVGTGDLNLVIANFGQGSAPTTPTSNGDVPDDPDVEADAGGVDAATGAEDDAGAGDDAGAAPAEGVGAEADDSAAAVGDIGIETVGSGLGEETPASISDTDDRGGTHAPGTPTALTRPAAYGLSRPARGSTTSDTSRPVNPAAANTKPRARLDAPASTVTSRGMTPEQQRAAVTRSTADALALARPATTKPAQPDPEPIRPPRRFDAMKMRLTPSGSLVLSL